MKKHTLSLTLSLCLGFTTLTACGPGPSDPMSALPNQTAVQPASTNSALALQAQAALASYHEVDASFADSQRLARSGQFSTKLLGNLLGDDDDNDNNSGSGSLNLGVGLNVDANGSGGSNTNSGSGSLGLGVDANVDANATGSGSGSNSGSGSLGVGVGANVDANATGSGSGSNSGSGSLGVGVGTNVDANASGSGTSSGNGSGSLGLGVGANVDATATGSGSGNSNSGSGSLNVGTNVGANLDAMGNSSNTGSGSSNGSLMLDTNLTADAMLSAFNDASNRFRSNIESSGYANFTDSGAYNVDQSKLQADLRSKLNLDAQFADNNDNESSQLWTDVNADALVRLKNRNYDTDFLNGGSQTAADGSVTTSFKTRFNGNGSERNIEILDHIKADVNTATDFKLTERGNGFSRNATRRSELMADGSVRLMTWVTTNFDNGDVLEIFEDRHGNAQGQATGSGTFSFKHRDGSTESGDLRTMIMADGSLNSYLNLNNGSDLMIRESANGQAQFSLRNGENWDSTWTNLDLNAMLNSMARIASND